MTDPRVAKLAQVLVRYSLNLQPGEEFALVTNPLAEELGMAVFREALQAGAHPLVQCDLPRLQETFLKLANEAQLDYVSPVQKLVTERFPALLHIGAPANTRRLAGIDPARLARQRRAGSEISRIFADRSARGELRWCYTIFPTQAGAQEAEMCLEDYENFVYDAGMLNRPDSVAAWKELSERQKRLTGWLAGHEQVVLKGKDIDLRMSIQGRSFIDASGNYNFPDGEIFTSPVEDSVDGWVRFAYPGIFEGQEVIDIELWFEGGKVVKERAAKGGELLAELLNTDSGARFLGELGIGTNYSIPRFTKNMLFDEKLGGTIHLAVGRGFLEAGGQNVSSLHWDMLCDMAESEIRVDGELFYKDGKFAV
jgi:aminopeptidase